jgi:hypothetical protein
VYIRRSHNGRDVNSLLTSNDPVSAKGTERPLVGYRIADPSFPVFPLDGSRHAHPTSTKVAEEETEVMAAMMLSDKVNAVRRGTPRRPDVIFDNVPSHLAVENTARDNVATAAAFSKLHAKEPEGLPSACCDKQINTLVVTVQDALVCVEDYFAKRCPRHRLDFLVGHASTTYLQFLNNEFKDIPRFQTTLRSAGNLVRMAQAECAKHPGETRCASPLNTALRVTRELESDTTAREWSNDDLRALSDSVAKTGSEMLHYLEHVQVGNRNMFDLLEAMERMDADLYIMKRLKVEAFHQTRFAKFLRAATLSFYKFKELVTRYPLSPKNNVVSLIWIDTDLSFSRLTVKKTFMTSFMNVLKSRNTEVFAYLHPENITLSFPRAVISRPRGRAKYELQLNISTPHESVGDVVDGIKIVCGSGALEKMVKFSKMPLYELRLIDVEYDPTLPYKNATVDAQTLRDALAGAQSSFLEPLKKLHGTVLSNVEAVKRAVPENISSVFAKRRVAYLKKTLTCNKDDWNNGNRGGCPVGMECRENTCYPLRPCNRTSDCRNAREHVLRSCFENWCEKLFPKEHRCKKREHCERQLVCQFGLCKKPDGRCEKLDDCLDPIKDWCGPSDVRGDNMGKCLARKNVGDQCSREDCGPFPMRCNVDGLCTNKSNSLNADCEDETDCREGLECFNKKCRGEHGHSCSHSQECSKNLVCESDRCVGDLGGKCNCKQGTACTIQNVNQDPVNEGSCQLAECFSTKDCPSKFVCHKKLCRRTLGMECAKASECFAPISKCEDGVCRGKRGVACNETAKGQCLYGSECYFDQCQLSKEKTCNGTEKSICIETCLRGAGLDQTQIFKDDNLIRSNYCGLCCLDCVCDNSDDGWIPHAVMLYGNALRLNESLPAPKNLSTVPAEDDPSNVYKGPPLMFTKDQLAESAAHIKWETLEYGWKKSKARKARAQQELKEIERIDSLPAAEDDEKKKDAATTGAKIMEPPEYDNNK